MRERAMGARNGWYKRTTLLPADHHATGSTRGMDTLPVQWGGYYCIIFFVHVPFASHVSLSPTFAPGAATFVSLSSPPLAIVQPFLSASVQVISAARDTGDIVD